MHASPTLAPPAASAEQQLRAALGQYPTGVAVITTVAADGALAGMTISSFTALSLDPPLILWCLRRRSSRAALFAAAPYFAVNVLAVGQAEVARRFARPNPNPSPSPGGGPGGGFAGLAWQPGPRGLPLLAGTAGAFSCRREPALDGGDHVILIGHVEDYRVTAGQPPLVRHAGRYTALRPGPPTLAAPAASG
jgi:flavin reductase (DIM6/NTAB) family NADH-FMN oxidoreductase RutF